MSSMLISVSLHLTGDVAYCNTLLAIDNFCCWIKCLRSSMVSVQMNLFLKTKKTIVIACDDDDDFLYYIDTKRLPINGTWFFLSITIYSILNNAIRFVDSMDYRLSSSDLRRWGSILGIRPSAIKAGRYFYSRGRRTVPKLAVSGEKEKKKQAMSDAGNAGTRCIPTLLNYLYFSKVQLLGRRSRICAALNKASLYVAHDVCIGSNNE